MIASDSLFELYILDIRQLEEQLSGYDLVFGECLTAVALNVNDLANATVGDQLGALDARKTGHVHRTVLQAHLGLVRNGAHLGVVQIVDVGLFGVVFSEERKQRVDA